MTDPLLAISAALQKITTQRVWVILCLVTVLTSVSFLLIGADAAPLGYWLLAPVGAAWALITLSFEAWFNKHRQETAVERHIAQQKAYLEALGEHEKTLLKTMLEQRVLRKKFPPGSDLGKAARTMAHNGFGTYMHSSSEDFFILTEAQYQVISAYPSWIGSTEPARSAFPAS